jgi:hypothetical protein
MKNYRKLYEQHYECTLLQGIDIHHIDGNHDNNHPSNLKAVTLEEHYSIHKEQKDFYAAYLIGQRMKIKPEDWSLMAKENGRKSGIQNRDNGIGLTVWAKNNPELAKKMYSENGKKSGKKNFENKIGLHAASKEQRKKWCSLAGKKAAELGLGFKAGHASSAGKIGGKKGGQYAKENKTGIHSLSLDKEKIRIYNFQIAQAVKWNKATAIDNIKIKEFPKC